MPRCPITYETLKDGEDRYSRAGLRRLSPSLEALSDLEFSAEEQRQEAMARATKLSIQGVQPKLSARLSPSLQKFVLVDKGGTFILKPQVHTFRSLPENEDLTMRLAETVGIEVPLHGMVFSKDKSLTYFIRRFDRVGRSGKRSVEDFAQLAGASRETKYDGSMEKLAALLSFTTFPQVERLELLKRVLFCFVVGNEDMHLKNWSLIFSTVGPKQGHRPERGSEDQTRTGLRSVEYNARRTRDPRGDRSAASRRTEQAQPRRPIGLLRAPAAATDGSLD